MENSKKSLSFKTQKSYKTSKDKPENKSQEVIKQKSSSTTESTIPNLIEFYRLKSDLYDKERLDLLEKLERLEISQEEEHKKDWEIKKKNEEIEELKNLLMQNNDVLNKERRQMLIYKFELQNKDHRTKEDRKRLMDLLKISEPVEQTISLYYDRRPDIKEKHAITDGYPIRRLNSKYKTQNKEKENKQEKNKQDKFNKTYKRINASEEKPIIKTVVMPNTEEDSLLKQENELLKRQIITMRNFYEDQQRKLEESRKVSEEHTKFSILSAKDKIEEVMKKNQKLEKLNIDLTKDYLLLKYETSQSERRIHEEIELLKLQNESLSINLNDILKQGKIERDMTKNEYERRKNHISSALSKQIKIKEDQNQLIKDQYQQFQSLYKSKVSELEKKLKEKSTKLKIIEGKRRNELEGVLNELALIRKRVKSYEDYVYKLKQFTDGEKDLTQQIKEDLKINNSNFLKGLDGLNRKINDFEKRIINQEENFQNDDLENRNSVNNYNRGDDKERDDDEDEDEDENNLKGSNYNNQYRSSNDYNKDSHELDEDDEENY